MCKTTYGDLEHELLTVVVGLERVQNRRQLGAVELDCRRMGQRCSVQSIEGKNSIAH